MIEGVPVGVLTPAGLILVTVLFVMTGRLIPRATHVEQLADKDAQLERQSLEIVWLRGANDNLQATVAEQAHQLESLLEIGRAQRDLLVALQQAGRIAP